MTEGPDEPAVGSVAEEAAKLLGAVQDWARTAGAGQASAAAGAADLLGARLHEVNEHLATGGESCDYCPVCQLIRAVRGTDPQVRTHLASAAGSLLQAAAGLLATSVPDATKPGTPVERIDLDDDLPS
jgi:hypothetical protein